uniref:Uncharacterized protein n=1 Tax=Anopheles stephensi TaxID=30069 RepID=A0A182YMN9_ANOST
MKVKVPKTLKPVEKSQKLLKKSKSGIQKAKTPKAALKPAVAKVAVAKAAKVATAEELPVKTAFSMLVKPKKQAQKKSAAVKKAEQENSPPLVKQANGTGPADAASKQKKAKAEPAVKQANGTGPVPAATKQANGTGPAAASKQKNAKNVPAAKQANGSGPVKRAAPVAQSKAEKGDNKRPESDEPEGKKSKKLLTVQMKALKRAERKVETGAPEKADEATLALVPQQLISKESFQKVFEIIRNKVDDKGKKLFGDDLKYSLQIVSVKVPRCPVRNSRLSLSHPLLRAEDEVCLIVKDLVRGRDVDFTPSLHHWEDKLSGQDFGYKLQIIPFQQLKRDYSSFEMKRKLAQRYERFLVDARIVGHVFAFLGSQFAKRCKNPAPVNLENESKIKEAIGQALRLQTYRQGNTGLSTEIKFAAHWMPVEHAVENGMELLEKLKTVYPGGWLNIQAINVTTATEKTSSFPIYVSTIDPNLVPIPTVVGPREKFVKKQQALIEKKTGGEYEVTKEGVVRKKRKLNLDGQPDDAEESDVEVEDLEPEQDDNWVPYDDDVPRRRRTGGGGGKRQKGPKMRCVLTHSPPVVIDKRVVLSSVYDAIKGNSIDPSTSVATIGEDSRNKRNVRYYTYDDPQNDDLFPGYGEIVHPPQSGPVQKQCKPEPSSAVQSISISDHSWTGIGSSIIHLLKYLIAGLAVLTLPVLLLQAFIIPLKILMGLKSVAVANTLVLGTFLWKYLNRRRVRDDEDDDDDDDDGGGDQQQQSSGEEEEEGEAAAEEEARLRSWPAYGAGKANMTKKSLRKPIMVLRSRKTAIIKDGVITVRRLF